MTDHTLSVERSYDDVLVAQVFIGTCDCGWTGPARIASQRALLDGREHELATRIPATSSGVPHFLTPHEERLIAAFRQAVRDVGGVT